MSGRFGGRQGWAGVTTARCLVEEEGSLCLLPPSLPQWGPCLEEESCQAPRDWRGCQPPGTASDSMSKSSRLHWVPKSSATESGRTAHSLTPDNMCNTSQASHPHSGVSFGSRGQCSLSNYYAPGNGPGAGLSAKTKFPSSDS